MSTRVASVVEPLGSDIVALAQCIAIDVASFPHPSLPPVLAGPIETHPVLVARHTSPSGERGPVQGFCVGRWRRGWLEVMGLAVDARSRRQGVGRSLLQAAVRLARARGVGAVVLHVSTGNPGARALYQSEGFYESRLLHHFYASDAFPDEGAAIEMILELGGG